MSTFKDVLCLLMIFIIYGIAGRLDYEDAVGLEQIRQERLHAACQNDLPAGHDALARVDDQRLHPPSLKIDTGLSADDLPCPRSVL